MSEILIVSDNSTRQQTLQIILTFLGENTRSCEYADCLKTIEQSTSWTAILIDGEVPEVAEDVIEKFPDSPFINIGFQLF